MKPDWQNKSFAKTSSPTAPSTTHAKLKLGMSSLHGKISAANNNMPQAPKPVVRKFADGGSVRTRSDDEIGDTNPRTGVVDPGSYDRRMKAGEENLNRLKSAVESVRSFFSRDKEAESSPSNITGDSGMSESDVAKKQSMSNMSFDKKEEPKAEVKAEVKAEEPAYKAAVVEAVTKPRAAVQDLPAADAAPAASSNAASSNTAVVKKANAKKANKKKNAQTNTSTSSAPAAVSTSSSDVAKSFSEDVAKRRAASMQPLSNPAAMFSDTMKVPAPPPPKKPRLHPRTGRPY